MWRTRADAALMHVDVQWAALLAGVSAAEVARANALELANYYRARDLPIVLMLDVTNGIARDREAPALEAAGRTIAEPAIQRLYRDYVVAIVDVARPTYIGLAAETNLIRAAAPRSVYDGIVRMTADAVADLRARGVTTPVFVSVQVETAWGRLASTGGTFVGIDQDLRDFPFIGALGLSSYPYLAGYPNPEDIPVDYYSRVVGSETRPVMVVEGGWTSANVPGLESSPEEQARYLRRQVALLESVNATAVFQLTFTDLDIAAIPQPPGSILPLFAALGMVDTQLRPKPALAVWDSLVARNRR
ncbi:MAG: ATPase with chaperone, ATP-binding subunit [Geminicoccaceae bacterium]|nr:ATPase with chaperone, ATP-binding subunit [Geminicoccaceae bacterium]